MAIWRIANAQKKHKCRTVCNIWVISTVPLTKTVTSHKLIWHIRETHIVLALQVSTTSTNIVQTHIITTTTIIIIYVLTCCGHCGCWCSCMFGCDWYCNSSASPFHAFNQFTSPFQIHFKVARSSGSWFFQTIHGPHLNIKLYVFNLFTSPFQSLLMFASVEGGLIDFQASFG